MTSINYTYTQRKETVSWKIGQQKDAREWLEIWNYVPGCPVINLTAAESYDSGKRIVENRAMLSIPIESAERIALKLLECVEAYKAETSN